MDNIIKVIAVDDNDIIRQMIVDTLQDDPDIEFAGEAANGEDAIALIKAVEPDIVLLDLVMPRIDGFGVIDDINEDITVKKKPEYIIISAAGSERIVSDSLRVGAAYFIMKPFDGNALLKQIKRLARKNSKTAGTEDKVTEFLKSIGMSIKSTGFRYIKSAISIALNNQDSIMSITKFIYPEVASEYDTSSGNVERNIRYAIESAWGKMDERYVDTVESVFGSIEKKPTNSEFILSCVDWISKYV